MSTRYRKTVLSDGLHVITEHVPHVRSIALGVWVCAGSRYESPEQHGVAHFLEHMLFKGTPTRNAYQIARSIESLGGYLNAFTGREVNCYYVRTLDEHAPVAVELLADILQHSRFDPGEIAKEKGVVLEEIKSQQDNPEDLAHEGFTTLVWDPHPLSRSILGTEAAVAGFTKTDLRSYLASWYRPDRIFLVAAGSVDHDELVDLAARWFRIPPGGPASEAAPSLPPLSKRMQVSKKDIAQTHLCVGGRGLPFRDDRKYVLFVLNTVLGGGMTSRLFQTIREQAGLVYSIYSDIELCEDTGLFCISAGTDAADMTQVLEMIYHECERMRREPISRQEMDDAGSQLIGGLHLSLENTSSVMNRLARMEIYLDTYHTVEETVQAINAVTRDQVQSLAEELLDPRRLCVMALGPVDDTIPHPA